jgi:hypothetical protein
MAVAVLRRRGHRSSASRGTFRRRFDDTTVSQIAIPAITTIHQPLGVGRMAVNLLARIMDEPPLRSCGSGGRVSSFAESTGPGPPAQ